MRLVVQAQLPAEQECVKSAFAALHPELRATLAREMALTGCEGEAYSLTPAVAGGPAFLIYYSPARRCSAARGRSRPR